MVPLVLVTSTTEVIRGVPRVRVNEAYTNALTRAGLVPLVLPPIAPEDALHALDSVAGLVLTGGEDLAPRSYGATTHPATDEPHPTRDLYELALARAAHDRRLPTLAICRGAQVVNVALGGDLIQDIPDECPGSLNHDPDGARDARVHRVRVERSSVLARALGASDLTANSSHHQAIGRPGRDLEIVARADDGIIEGIESARGDWWMVAVQWHPEELTATPADEDWDRRLFQAFAAAVRGVMSSSATALHHAPAASNARESAPPGRTTSRSRR
jgi:putative glutamine amidotransferase